MDLKMKSKLVLVLGTLLAFGIVLVGCDNGSTGGDNNGGGNKITIKNSTQLTFTGIEIEDASGGNDNIGYIVGSDSAPEPINIGPGGTYTSPEIKCSYVNWYVYSGDTVIGQWGASDNDDNWEVYINANGQIDTHELVN
jgi:hypothetical protein